MRREPLPARRHCFSFPLRFNNLEFTVGLGPFEDGRPAEVFVTGPKAGTDIQSLSRDGAILLSIALQFGAPLDVIRHAMTRDGRDAPASLIGALSDAMAAEAGWLSQFRGPPPAAPAAVVEPRAPNNNDGGAQAVEATPAE